MVPNSHDRALLLAANRSAPNCNTRTVRTASMLLQSLGLSTLNGHTFSSESTMVYQFCVIMAIGLHSHGASKYISPSKTCTCPDCMKYFTSF